MDSKRCLYCNRDAFEMKALGRNPAFSDEHILPEDLTEKLPNNPFVIPNVHRYCNNLAGMFMDAAVTRFWLIYSEKAMRAADYISIENHPALPLVYMGTNTELSYQGKVCDNWIGPAAASIFHFHDPYPTIDDTPAMVGVPPAIKRKVDKGFAFLVFSNTNSVWYTTILRSYAKHFKGTTLYLANMDSPGNLFPNVPEELKELNEEIVRPGSNNVNVPTDVTADHRFLAKMAIGIGAKYLGERFLKNPIYERLRNFMWAKTSEGRKRFSFPGKGLLQIDEKSRELSEELGWEGCHTLIIVNKQNVVAIFLTVYKKFCSYVKIDTNGENYTNEIGEGITFVISPGLKRVVGPLDYNLFCQHKLGFGAGIPELKKLDDDLKNTIQNPPFNL